MAAVSHNEWQLRQGLVALSQANDFQAALPEWKIEGVEDLEAGEESETCLCGHHPIREVFTVTNAAMHTAAKIGNVCIKFFKSDERFEGAHTIISSMRGLRHDPSASANPALIRLAQESGIITAANKIFYSSIWRKRNLTEGQETYKLNLNQNILLGLIYTAGQAFQRMSENLTSSAGPKLIEHAYQKGVLAANQKAFYSSIWTRSHGSLSPSQRNWKASLNQKMINSRAVLGFNAVQAQGAVVGESAAMGERAVI